MSEKSAGADHSTGDEATREAARLSRRYLDALRAADAAGAYRVAARALEGGMTVAALYQRVITPAMHAIGDLWAQGAITVADEHLATALTHRVLTSLRPLDLNPSVSSKGESERPLVLLAAVEGEQHALGLRMVADLAEDAGHRVVYLGADVPTDALLQAVASLAPDLLALSATMPELSPTLRSVTRQIRGERPEVELLLGGQAAALPPRAEGEKAALVQDLEALPRHLIPPT